MHPNQDFNLRPNLPWNEWALTIDLELETIFQAMGGEDKFLLDIARKSLFGGFENTVEAILYRQAVLKDCLENQSIIREMYQITIDTVEEERKHWWLDLSKTPTGVISESIGLLEMLVKMLRKLREIANININNFHSEGFIRFFKMIQQEVGEDYLNEITQHLEELRFSRGTLFSTELRIEAIDPDYILRKQPPRKSWLQDWLFELKNKAYTYHLDPRDEAGATILGNLKDRGLNNVANALGQASEHVKSFLHVLRQELAFYVCCLNLHEKLSSKSVPICFPNPLPENDRKHRFKDLRDTSLALNMKQPIVGNSVDANGKELIIISGANQGGKSSFLRSIGIAQIIMQSGCFVSANEFESELCPGIYTHYKREEDPTMSGGKFDEELVRMGEIVDHIHPNSLMLFNESFTATNAREGAEIARQITTALLKKRIKIFYVSHLYEFTHPFFEAAKDTSIFLRAERNSDGTRPFQLIEGEPLETSYGADLYSEIFGN